MKQAREVRSRSRQSMQRHRYPWLMIFRNSVGPRPGKCGPNGLGSGRGVRAFSPAMRKMPVFSRPFAVETL